MNRLRWPKIRSFALPLAALVSIALYHQGCSSDGTKAGGTGGAGGHGTGGMIGPIGTGGESGTGGHGTGGESGTGGHGTGGESGTGGLTLIDAGPEDAPMRTDAATDSLPADVDDAADDAIDDAAATCIDNGVTYPVGATIQRSPCTTCRCLTGGVVGQCTGACPPDAA